MSFQLNINATSPDGQTIPEAILECVVLDKNLVQCPFEPKIKQQPNFYNGDVPFATAMGEAHPGPYFVYGTAQAAGMNPGYFPRDGGFGVPWDGLTSLTISVPLTFKLPFRAMPLFWKANMCGIRIPGLPDVLGGAAGNPDLFLSWFYHLYAPKLRRTVIQPAYKDRGLTHWLTSWPDAQDAGVTPEQFAAQQVELIAGGFYPCPFLSAKPTSSANVRTITETLANIKLVLPHLIAAKVPAVCIGWEMSLWVTPTELAWLRDQLYPLIIPYGLRFYLHLQEGYPSFQEAGGTVADFWWGCVGKFTGLLYQKYLDQNDAQFLDSISDNLQRFCGGFNMPDHSGVQDGPFTWTALELDAMKQYNNNEPEAEGDRLGQLAINAPSVIGPTGVRAFVNGAGNGI